MNDILNQFYNNFYTPAIKDKKPLHTQELYNLYKRPKKIRPLKQPPQTEHQFSLIQCIKPIHYFYQKIQQQKISMF